MTILLATLMLIRLLSLYLILYKRKLNINTIETTYLKSLTLIYSKYLFILKATPTRGTHKINTTLGDN